MMPIERAREALAGAKSVVALTGAGVSAESGVPTFRGEDGLWKDFRPEELATPEAFERDPRLVWEWYDWRRQKLAPLAPNPGHHALAAMERRFDDFLLVTQNVDGLHRAAGSRRLVELHGNIWFTRCTGDGQVREDRTVPLSPLPPRCACGALLRPHIVWFGESLDEEALGRAMEACNTADVMIVAGTSSLVYPAAGLAVLAKEAGAFVIEINREKTPATAMVDVHLDGPSGDVLPQLLE